MAKYPIDYATRMAKAIASASRSLATEDAEQAPAWRELLCSERAWPLSVLLAFWYLLQTGREPAYGTAIQSLADDSRSKTSAADFYGIWRYFDTYQSLLSRPAQLAYEAKTSSDLALAGGAFKYAAKKIGTTPLALALDSSLFTAVSERLRQVVPEPRATSSEMKVSLTAAPMLSAQDRCVLLLVSRGHSQNEAEQICQGPPRLASRPVSVTKGKKA